MPGKGKYTKEFDACVAKVKKSNPKGNAFAICTASFRKSGKKIWIGEEKLSTMGLRLLEQYERDYMNTDENTGLLAWMLQEGGWGQDWV